MIPRARVSIFLSSNSLRCFTPPLIRHFSTPPRPPSDKDQSPEPIQFPKYNVKTYGADVKKFSQLPVNFGANQHISIDDQLKEKLRSVLWKFNAPIRYAFAYGSGVFQQANADPKDVASFALRFINGKMPMVDFIFGVSHTQHWHGLNLVQNPHHYSGMRYLGSGAISWVQDDSGAGVYFNPYVEVGGLTIKYGVVNIETLCRDLLEWDTLYLAGRLQKPVKILRDEPRVRLANQVNLVSALRAALLLLPEEFTEFDLYSTIAGLSYMGDFRTRLPTENPQKVQNIVTKQVVHFRRLYSPLLDTLPNVTISQDHTDPSHTILKQDFSPTRRANMVARLPSSFKSILYRHYARKFNVPLGQLQSGDAYGGEFEMKVAADEGLRAEVKRSIRETVGWVSFVQTFKGLFTAGVGRSIKYVFAKVGKWWSGQGKVDVGKDKEK